MKSGEFGSEDRLERMVSTSRIREFRNEAEWNEEVSGSKKQK